MFPLGTKGYDPLFHDSRKRNEKNSRIYNRLKNDEEIEKRNGQIYKSLSKIHHSKTRKNGLIEEKFYAPSNSSFYFDHHKRLLSNSNSQTKVI